MRPRVLWLSLLLACATRKPTDPGKPAPAKPDTPTTARPAPAPRTDDEICRLAGHDFAYPDFERDAVRNLRCGDGPGTDCYGGQTHCEGVNLVHCQDGKLTALDCREMCQQHEGVYGETSDGGTCTPQRDRFVCICCDAGEPGCEHIKPTPPRPVVPLAPTARTP